MTKVSITTLLDAGAHFGIRPAVGTRKMQPYIFGNRGDIYIIDLKQTLYGLDAAYTFVSNLTRKGGTVLFVGTKQAQRPSRDHQPLRHALCERPLARGMLTNFATIRTRVKPSWRSWRPWMPTVACGAASQKEQILLLRLASCRPTSTASAT